MALTYTQTTDWTSAGTLNGVDSYKDVTVSCASGDLLVAFGAAESWAFSSTTRSITTNTGSTSAWTTSTPTVIQNDDVDVIAGWATVTSGTSVTVRVQVRCGSGEHMGACVFVIPAADWDSGTSPAFTAFVADANAQVSATLSNTSIVIYAGADWAALNPGTYATPSGGTGRASLVDAGRYSVAVRSWTGQTAATRTYGPSQSDESTPITGTWDMSGAIVVVKEAAAGGADITATAVAGTAAVPSWASNVDIVIGGVSKQGIWT